MRFSRADGFVWNDAEGIEEIYKSATEVAQYRIHWHDFLRGDDRYWDARSFFLPGETATPPRSALNGHRYRCTVGGRTGAAAPTFPTAGTTPFADGGVTWARIGLEDRIASSDFTAESGITIDAESVDATNCVALVTLSGGVAGQSYLITDTIVTDAGLTELERFRVHVRPA